MSIEVVMPQMGESITEGTVSKWLKSVGDKITKDEPILEISTDKVDAEVPSPGEGVLVEIRHNEGETVEVGTVVAVIGAEGEQAVASPSASAEPQETQPVEPAPASSPQAADATPASESAATDTSMPDAAKEAAVEPATASPTASSGPSTEVVMPQMGESITEGTVSKWLKSVGDDIAKDEPLLEISTDKVDAEVPSPAAGKLLEIKVNEGETVEVGSVLALVGSAEGASAPQAPEPAAAPAANAPTPAGTIAASQDTPASNEQPVRATAAAAGSGAGMPVPTAKAAAAAGNGADELRRLRSSPLVRKIAAEHGVDISRIDGSGLSGRVTKGDILSFIETGAALRPEDLLVGKAAGVAAPSSASARPAAPAPAPGTGDRVEKMSVMRKKIAEHMTMSKQTSAHVTSVYEIDMTRVAKFREQNKKAFQERYGTKLTFMPFIFQAVTHALRELPIVNAQVSGENIIYKRDIDLGMAVALDWGLIVPVIRQADTLSLAGLALAANDLADRARAKKLSPDEVAGGTFTITNPGVFGGLFGTPIINQPQVAIMCVGAIEKRPRVLTTPDGDDYIAIRSMAYFALTYDHRIVDGADGERFLAFVKEFLETTEFAI